MLRLSVPPPAASSVCNFSYAILYFFILWNGCGLYFFFCMSLQVAHHFFERPHLENPLLKIDTFVSDPNVSLSFSLCGFRPSIRGHVFHLRFPPLLNR